MQCPKTINRLRTGQPKPSLLSSLKRPVCPRLTSASIAAAKAFTPSKITAWRQAFITGQKSEKAQQKEDREQSRKDKKRIQELERELRRKDKALAETAALLVLRKKLNDYWGTNDNEDN